MVEPMASSEFRRHGHALVDWIAEYLDTLDQRPVRATVEPGEVRGRLPDGPPADGEPFEAILRDVEEVILPGLTHWQSPTFFGYFPANASYPSILGELLSAGLGVQGMLWSTSPAATELETQVLDWLVELLALPDRFRSTGAGGGVIQESASSATLCVLVAARDQAVAAGADRAALTVYATPHAHSSVDKALRIAGFGPDQHRVVAVGDDAAMAPEDLDRQLLADRRAGWVPCAVVATVGTTSSTAIDPLEPIGRVCGYHGAWLHVDGALAGAAAVCPELRWIHDGLHHADSYVVNPHKWMLVNFDCSCLYVADRTALTRALAVQPEYLRDPASQSGQVVDYRDWQIPLGRRFRALKLWFVLRCAGRAGLRDHVRRHVTLAGEFADWVEADGRFELAAPVWLNLVCFRHRGGDAVNEAILERVNASGRVLLSHTRLDGRHTLRLAVGAPRTGWEHVELAWWLVSEAADVATGGQIGTSS